MSLLPSVSRRLSSALVLAALTCALASAQPVGWRREDVRERPYGLPGRAEPRFGERYIDTLPRSEYPVAPGQQPFTYLDQGLLAPENHELRLALHPKSALRVGPHDLERLAIVELFGPARDPGAELSLFADGQSLWREPAGWMDPTGPMRACWLPVVTGQECELALRVGGQIRERLPCALDEDVPSALFEVSCPDEPHECDRALGLKPAWVTLAPVEGRLRIRFAAARGLHGTLTTEARWQDEDRAGPLWSHDVSLAGQGCRETWWTESTGLRPGTHPLLLTARLDGEPLAQLGQEVQVVPRIPAAPFGARYVTLRHPGPVYINHAETLPWDAVWQGKKARDVVVDFPGRPAKFVFWRGASYVPCWALPNAWLCYEWLESEPEINGAVDCVEPLQDKECRFSDVRVLESSPARVVVHWRYALTDLDYRIINGEWADEYFTLYPDGVGTRLLVGWIRGWGWHETQEFIIANRPGNRPWKALDFTALTLLSTDGQRAEATWPRPRFEADDWPDYIARVNLRDSPDPFQVSAGGSEVYLKAWYQPPADKPGLFNAYLHWPITRGVRTTWLDDPCDFVRPTHTNLLNIVNPPDERTEDRQVWSWLIGLAPPEHELVALARSWLHPGRVVSASEGLSGGEYDQHSRAYVLQARNAPAQAALTLQPEADAPVVNPAFVVSDWRGPAEVLVDGLPGRARVGVERQGQDLVVFIEGHFREETRLVLRRPPARP